MKKLIVFIFSVVLLGSCDKEVEGCTDPLSNNYDPQANTDNGFCVPTVITNEISEIHSTFIFTGGNVINEGGSSVTGRGICWSINPSPTISDNATDEGNDGIGEFNQSIYGFISNTNYYVRAYATNSNGTGYGEEIPFTSFKEVQYGNGVTDIDGNNYSSVIIDDQEWMSENLKVSKFNNGSSITSHSPSTPNSSWMQSTTPGYINLDGNTYYNSYVTTSNEEVCPVGWHLPSNQDFTNLKNFVEESGFTGELAGRALSSVMWKVYSPGNASGIRTDDFGFNAKGHGIYRGYLGSDNTVYDGYYEKVNFWAENYNEMVISYTGFTGIGNVGNIESNGLSIRCLKD